MSGEQHGRPECKLIRRKQQMAEGRDSNLCFTVMLVVFIGNTIYTSYRRHVKCVQTHTLTVLIYDIADNMIDANYVISYSIHENMRYSWNTILYCSKMISSYIRSMRVSKFTSICTSCYRREKWKCGFLALLPGREI